MPRLWVGYLKTVTIPVLTKAGRAKKSELAKDVVQAVPDAYGHKPEVVRTSLGLDRDRYYTKYSQVYAILKFKTLIAASSANSKQRTSLFQRHVAYRPAYHERPTHEVITWTILTAVSQEIYYSQKLHLRMW